jgi:hypothetical protein
MHTRRKILFGVAALALPLTGFAVLGTPMMFAGASAPAFPVVCKVAGTVTFSPALTKAGTHTTNKAAVTTVTISSGRLSACLSAAPIEGPGHGTFPTTTIRLPAVSVGRIGGVKTYATGYCPAFESATLKALKGLKLDVTWTPSADGSSTFTTKKVTTASNKNSELGFVLNGKEGLGSYMEKSLNQITAFIDASDSSALTTGCAASQTVSSVTFDASNSVTIL